jgi:hypothetical protein
MTNPPTRPGPEEAHPDDQSIPVLTDRLGLPPLEFDTTLPMFESTSGSLEPELQSLTALPGAPPPPPAVAPMNFAPTGAPGPATAAAPPPGTQAPNPVPTTAVPLARTGAGMTAVSPPPFLGPAASPAARPAAAPQAATAGGAPGFHPTLAVAPPPGARPPAAGHAPGEPDENVRVIGDTVGNPLAATPAASDGRHWARVEMELRTSILREIAVQLPREVEAIVQKRMSGTIEKLLASLASETRMAVAASLREIVERAVHAELERLRNSNRG